MVSRLDQDIWSEVKALSRNNRSGASEITEKALKVMERAIQALPSREIIPLVMNIVRAQPSMAPLFNLANSFLWAAEGCGWSKGPLMKWILDYALRFREAPKRLASIAAKELKDTSSIMTYSKSSTVLMVLEELRKVGGDPLIVISEGRPVGEGVDTAHKLLEMGFKVRLAVDAALFHLMADVDAVVVGGDALGERWLVNKIGTLGLASHADRIGKEFLVLITEDKFVPPNWESRLRIEEMDPDEVLDYRGEGMKVFNRYFDMTPLDYISMIITEEGGMRPDGVRKRVNGIQIHPVLRD